jgi:CHAT domain-containing protein
VLQYGVTRDTLREALEDGEGWDVIHFSGHGLPGALVLETPDGQSDLITSAGVNDLLRPASQRLKLVTLSACLSAAASIEQALTWMARQTLAAVWRVRRRRRPVRRDLRPRWHGPSPARLTARCWQCATRWRTSSPLS